MSRVTEFPIERNVQLTNFQHLHHKYNIMKCLKSKYEGFKTPTNEQLMTYLNKQNQLKIVSEYRAANEKPVISLAALGKWLGEHSKIPDDEHEVYVIMYNLNWGTSPNFCFAITTKHLLKFCIDAQNIVADTKNQLTWQGHSIVTVGTITKNNIFIPISMAVSTENKWHFFKMLFENLKQSVSSVHSKSMNPCVLVGDGSKNMQAAFKQVLGTESVVRVCWTVVKNEIEKKILELVDENYRKPLLQDVCVLRDAHSLELLNKGLEAFFVRYVTQKQFLIYFKQHWVEKNKNWYFGATGMAVAKETNETLYAFTKSIKDSNTFSDRLLLNEFLAAASCTVFKWSRYNTLASLSKFPNRILTVEDWKEAYTVYKTVPCSPFSGENNTDTYFTPTEVGNTLH
ncbi:uncharacterized protein LOC114359037 [Ostrinia furnacalis]|uniref:uncharacterized protein LOC114359037 n=1 Tax=Ostrinia furnacalis TaxID=93504 RepID=UPI00103DFA71|nr:uncharacterized protein LOC114359037 [Ostrinia furnacalis]